MQTNIREMRDPRTSEKELRSILKSRSLKLSGVKLSTALDLMSDFYKEVRNLDLVAEEGDGLAAYKDVTDNGRGTRVEIGCARLFRLTPTSRDARSQEVH